MGIIKPTNKSVESFKGLHLYHANMSNCAMRVRIALEEKGLNWTSHLLDLMKGENLTDEYFGITLMALSRLWLMTVLLLSIPQTLLIILIKNIYRVHYVLIRRKMNNKCISGCI